MSFSSCSLIITQDKQIIARNTRRSYFETIKLNTCWFNYGSILDFEWRSSFVIWVWTTYDKGVNRAKVEIPASKWLFRVIWRSKISFQNYRILGTELASFLEKIQKTFLCWTSSSELPTTAVLNCYQPIRKQFLIILQNLLLWLLKYGWPRYNKVNLESIVLQWF